MGNIPDINQLEKNIRKDIELTNREKAIAEREKAIKEKQKKKEEEKFDFNFTGVRPRE